MQKTNSSLSKSRFNKREFGREVEDLARRLVVESGYVILDYNWHFGRLLELDFVARSPDGVIVFVEVRTGNRIIPGSEIISYKKRERIRLGARIWMKSNGINELQNFWRIDLIIYDKLSGKFTWWKGVI